MRGFSTIFTTILLAHSILAQCPWQKDVPDLQTACLCAYNLGHELSVQCDQVRKTNLFNHFFFQSIRFDVEHSINEN